MRWILLTALVATALPAQAHEKVADKCGCHSQYGLRHCHPRKKSRACEAPVKGKVVQNAKPDSAAPAAPKQTSL
jgi:hypothetical protein